MWQTYMAMKTANRIVAEEKLLKLHSVCYMTPSCASVLMFGRGGIPSPGGEDVYQSADSDPLCGEK